MPSGQTHDRITLWSLPVVAGITFGQTRSSHLTLIVAGCFLFSGLMFGPDLDIRRSYHFQRWGWLRWLWLPYQKSVRHRSFLSHGPIMGTAVRVLYLSIWLVMGTICVVLIAGYVWEIEWNLSEITRMLLRSLSQDAREWCAIFIGLELGAMSHYLSDWTLSGYKRLKTKGISGLLFSTSPTKKRKSSSTRRSTSNSVQKRNSSNNKS